MYECQFCDHVVQAITWCPLCGALVCIDCVDFDENCQVTKCLFCVNREEDEADQRNDEL